jgi:cytochrome c biogenesis protein
MSYRGDIPEVNPILKTAPMKELTDKVDDKGKEKGYLTILYDFFRSLKLTIFLLILLALVSIIGTVITQNATPQEYVQRYGSSLYEVLDFFHLFDMYHSWWFQMILVMLVINLIACSLQRFPGTWNQVVRGPRPGGLEDSLLRGLPYTERIKDVRPISKMEENIQSLVAKGFGKPMRIETESAITFFGEKGKISRLGAYITHLSLLIVIIGGLVGSISGFRGFVNILEGETVNRVFIREKRGEVPRPLDFSVRCDDFNVTFYDVPGKQKFVKEYASTLTVLEKGKEVLKKTIQVNHPLHYRGLAFYQSSYGALREFTIGITGKNRKEKITVRAMEGDTFPIMDSNVRVRVLNYAPQIHNFGEGVQVVLLRPNQPARSYWLLRNGSFPPFDEKKGDDVILSMEALASKEYTGLQVTKDPGVWIVWVGCSLMIFGFIVSFYFSHQRIWVRIPKEGSQKGGREIVLAGSVNRNRIGFEKAFQSLVEGVRSMIKE